MSFLRVSSRQTSLRISFTDLSVFNSNLFFKSWAEYSSCLIDIAEALANSLVTYFAALAKVSPSSTKDDQIRQSFSYISSSWCFPNTTRKL